MKLRLSMATHILCSSLTHLTYALLSLMYIYQYPHLESTQEGTVVKVVDVQMIPQSAKRAMERASASAVCAMPTVI